MPFEIETCTLNVKWRGDGQTDSVPGMLSLLRNIVMRTGQKKCKKLDGRTAIRTAAMDTFRRRGGGGLGVGGVEAGERCYENCNTTI